MMRVFVTVGSTKFDSLVQTASSQPVLDALLLKGYTSLVVQCGNSDVEDHSVDETFWTITKNGVQAEIWRFKPSLEEEFEKADLVISHAG